MKRERVKHKLDLVLNARGLLVKKSSKRTQAKIRAIAKMLKIAAVGTSYENE